VNWIANFAIIEAFPTLQSGIGLPWVMVLLSALCVMAMAFIFRFLPETKGLSVEEVVALFDEQARGASARPARSSA
jgi:hypothetical protein